MINRVKTLVLEVATQLKQSSLMLATAESCTGGGLSYWLTSVPGSSDWLERGFVTYSNAAKIDMLDVNPGTIKQFGAVSRETAREMAQGALHRSQANISVAITGIAGPSGGSPEKPIGTIWIAVANKAGVTEEQGYLFSGDRQDIRLQAIISALEKVIDMTKASGYK